MIDSMREFSPRSLEKVSPNSISASADISVSDAFKKLPKNRRPLIKRLAIKAVLTASAFSIIISSGCGNKEQQNSPTPLTPTPISTPLAPEATKTPEPTLTPKPAETMQEPQYEYEHRLGLKVAFDKKNGLPAKYIFEDGREVKFDMEEVGKIREKALSSGESEIVSMVLLDNAIQNPKTSYLMRDNNYSLDHPKTAELPKDVLSEDELMDRGVTVFQAENITNFYIRKGAFEEGAILANFNHTGKELKILILDGSVIDPKYLNDPKYQDAINKIPEENRSVKDRRDYMIKNAGWNLEGMRRAIKKLKESNKTIDPYYEESIFEQKKIEYRYKNLMTDDQILKEYFSENAQGLHSPSKDNKTIFLSLGGRNFNYVTIYIDPDGFGRIQSKTSSGSAGRVEQKQTYPNPQDFQINPTASPNNTLSYPYAAVTPGLVARHELVHTESEYETDMKAMQSIRDAWDKWVESGYKDNTGYHFVFRLPPEAGGGYILTRGKKPKSPTHSL